jgi:hypothetical protein
MLRRRLCDHRVLIIFIFFILEAIERWLTYLVIATAMS